jgi:hypothetical protein
MRETRHLGKAFAEKQGAGRARYSRKVQRAHESHTVAQPSEGAESSDAGRETSESASARCGCSVSTRQEFGRTIFAVYHDPSDIHARLSDAEQARDHYMTAWHGAEAQLLERDARLASLQSENAVLERSYSLASAYAERLRVANDTAERAARDAGKRAGELEKAAEDALDSLEYVQRNHPVSGSAVRAERIEALRAALARVREGKPECGHKGCADKGAHGHVSGLGEERK